MGRMAAVRRFGWPVFVMNTKQGVMSNLDARLRRSMREEIRTLQQRLGLRVSETAGIVVKTVLVSRASNLMLNPVKDILVE